jgi:tRNA A-37 threonylcarbamoyl transferase component Bud32
MTARPGTAMGRTLGNYRLGEEIGAGGMGVVYVAEHTLIGRKAAVKTLLPELCNDRVVVDRFFNEARAATLIHHPGIVDIYDFGYADDGAAYIVMEFLEGVSLQDRIDQRGRLSEAEVVAITRQLTNALGAAHAAGIVHRDLKPDNVFLVGDGAGGERAKILDFGIAKLSAEQMGGVRQTRTGTAMGSPLFMSPEQCSDARDVDGRADIYSLGCVMYAMACGRPPFDGRGMGEVIAKHIYEPPVAPAMLAPGLSPRLDAVILRALAKKPEQRFQTMAAVAEALDGGGELAMVPALPVGERPQRASVAPTMMSNPGTAPPTMVRRGRGGLIALLASVVVVAAVIGLVVASNHGDGSDGATTATTAAGGTSDPAAVSEAGGATEPGAAVGAAAVVADAAPAATPMVSFKITSTPSGALVRDGDHHLLGETPFSISAPKNGDTVHFLVTQVGFEDADVALVADDDHQQAIDLVPVAHDGSAPPPHKKTSSSKKHDPPSKKKKGGFGETIDPLAD